jgi:poly(3-hydroxybutyrate) depolymerase
MSEASLFEGAHQPARRDFGIAHVFAYGESRPVLTRNLVETPFWTLVQFAASDVACRADLLLVTPLSGHFSFIVRDLVIGLLPYFRVCVTDWVNVRHVAAEHGEFGLGTNISSVLTMIRSLSPGANVVALCQGGVPALAATALLARENDVRTPAALVLIAAPVDPLANPTRVAQLIRAKPLSWFEETLIATVPEDYPGRGRRVYPAHLQLMALQSYLARRVSEGGELFAKLLQFDDGCDPAHFPFLELYTSIMDLDAAFFLENTRAVFHDCLLRNGALFFDGQHVDPGRLRETALLTIEGEWDDIAAPGQTSAAHGLCSSLPACLRREMVIPHTGHFSLFHGETCRREIVPAIKAHCDA